MEKIFRKTRLTATFLVGAALSVSAISAPRPAQADAGLVAALGGATLLGGLLYAHSQLQARPRPSVTQTVIYPTPKSRFYHSPTSAAIVYSSVSPVVMQQAFVAPVGTTAYTTTMPTAQPVVATGVSPSGVFLYQAAAPVVATTGPSNPLP